MPLNSVGDTPFDPRSQLLLLRSGTASELGPSLDHLPTSRGPNPGLGLHRSSPHVPTSCLLDSSGQHLCQVPAEPQEVGCGWRACAPTCLQVLHTPQGFLFFLCVASFLQGAAVNGLVNTVVTSLERRFDLHSYQSGLIASSYDIASCLCLTFVSYFGGQGHKPRWLGWGVLVMGTGSLVFALPHFTVGRYQAQVAEGVGACPADRSTGCADHASGLSSYRLVFMLGQFLHGMGATPLYTLGVTYLDENVKSSHSPIYFAIFYTMAILGPAAGYLIGGALLTVHTDLGSRTELSTSSPRWVGAWWVGFLGTGAAAFLLAMPILAYPRQLPGSRRYVVMQVTETQQLGDSGHKATSNQDFRKSLRDLPLSVWLLLKNPAFLLLCLAGATEATLVAGMSTFGPKFFEAQFSLSASEAATLFGFLVVPAGGGGTFLGGFLLNRFKLRGPSVVRLCLLCTLTSLLATLVFLTHCPNAPVAGVTAAYDGSPLPEGHQNLTAACHAACGCRPEHYSPVCGANGLTYYSPCHAGCPAATEEDPAGQRVHRGCSCVPRNLSYGPGQATAGRCPLACHNRPLLLAFTFLLIFLTLLGSIPALTATLRCVGEQQRSFALGIQWLVVRTLGSIPGPIAFGWVIDKACLLWQDQCGQPGSCFVYQNGAMSRYMLGVGLTYKVLGLIFFAGASYLYKPPPAGSPDGLEASLPSQSSASDSPADPNPRGDV
ncbi:solute carrier organic anion transporter family member 4A1 [Ochotona princeps]|uniref:solute carrier organic anion transporter family member 4A1 n=1 Tax=Ochotona princeps TaxID=9978 RepID=UPI00271496EB|nr:solute carrier organic anion transporter family member 4A1 [Ochotona princeps]